MRAETRVAFSDTILGFFAGRPGCGDCLLGPLPRLIPREVMRSLLRSMFSCRCAS